MTGQRRAECAETGNLRPPDELRGTIGRLGRLRAAFGWSQGTIGWLLL